MAKVGLIGFLLSLCAVSVAIAGPQPDELMPGKIAIVKPGTLVKFVAKPLVPAVFGLPDATNDPIMNGATLEIADTVTRPSGTVTFALAAGSTKWKALGNPPGSKGYIYKGTGLPGDPCKVVIIKPKVVKAVCKGTDITLTVPFSGDLAVVLSVGTSTKRYCAEYGGTAAGDPARLFKHKNALAPGGCFSVATATPTPTPTDTPTQVFTSTPTNTPPVPCNNLTAPACGGGGCSLGLTCQDAGGFCTCMSNPPTPTFAPTNTPLPGCGAAAAPVCNGTCIAGTCAYNSLLDTCMCE